MKHQVRLQILDELQRLDAVGRRGDDLDVGELLELVGQLLGGEFFVVHQDRGDGRSRAILHEMLVYQDRCFALSASSPHVA